MNRNMIANPVYCGFKRIETMYETIQETKPDGKIHTREQMASPNSSAVMILTQLGMEEARAKKQVTEGAIYLYSVRTKITDTSVIALAEHCSGLTEIYLGACFNITDTSVIALAENCPGLREIGLGACFNITDASVTALVEN